MERIRSTHDRRIVNARLTEPGRQMLEKSPPLLDETFMRRFSALSEGEQQALKTALGKIVQLLDHQPE